MSGVFFFFKQKTAYEMRMSDLSSDVCSSDLYAPPEDAMVEKMAYANRDTGNVLGAAETAGMTEYLDHPAINPKQSKHWALDIAVAFPTLHINLSPGGFWSHRFWPISVNRTRWEAEFH